MKKFCIHISIFVSILLLGVLGIFYAADGHADSFYEKISSPKQKNLILGTSKAAQGVQPEILKKQLNQEFFNFAFTLQSSSYGKVYLQNIQKKLDTTSSTSQDFILTVDPWSISSSTKNPNDSLSFRENNSFLNQINSVTNRPNFNYLIHHFEHSYFKILTKDQDAFLHPDGWLEVTLNDDENDVERRTNFNIKNYKAKTESFQFSEFRYQYLLKTITYLKQYGDVHLVRLPVHPDLMELENQVIPNFNRQLQRAIQHANSYIDLTPMNATFSYIDGVHLMKESGEEVSKIIAEKIKAN